MPQLSRGTVLSTERYPVKLLQYLYANLDYTIDWLIDWQRFNYKKDRDGHFLKCPAAAETGEEVDDSAVFIRRLCLTRRKTYKPKSLGAADYQFKEFDIVIKRMGFIEEAVERGSTTIRMNNYATSGRGHLN